MFGLPSLLLQSDVCVPLESTETMSRYPKADLSKVQLQTIQGRPSRVSAENWGKPYDPTTPFAAFVDSLPDVLAARELLCFAAAIGRARSAEKPIIALLGGHVVKVGLVPLLIDLMEEGWITGVGMNSAAAIHDVESVLFGETSEDVAAAIADGSFGMARETGEFINGRLLKGYEGEDSDIGYGEALAEGILELDPARPSILAAALRLGLPVSVHAAIGTDIVHQHPTMRGDATGEMSHRDFRLLCHQIGSLGEGGVVMNIGSNVILPEVFLKALTVARNLGADVRNFTTANFDMIRHYRPDQNVVKRPVLEGGAGFSFIGHHELMIPLLAAILKSGEVDAARIDH